MEIDIDINSLVKKLSHVISEQTVQIAILEAQLEVLQLDNKKSEKVPIEDK